MHRVLQQQWINGKACLVEDGELDALLDILNLSSEKVEEQREADLVSDRNEEEFLAHEHLPEDAEDDIEVTVAVVGAGDDEFETDTDTGAMISDEGAIEQEEEVPETAALELQEEEPAAEPDEGDRVVTWIYWPNGLLVKQ